MNAFWASENLDAFIALRSFPAGRSVRKTLPNNDSSWRLGSPATLFGDILKALDDGIAKPLRIALDIPLWQAGPL
jgi:hypothetical protein